MFHVNDTVVDYVTAESATVTDADEVEFYIRYQAMGSVPIGPFGQGNPRFEKLGDIQNLVAEYIHEKRRFLVGI